MNVAAEYCKYRRNLGGDPYPDRTQEMLTTFYEVGDSAG